MKRFEDEYRRAADARHAQHPMPETLRAAAKERRTASFGWVKYAAAAAACAVILLGAAFALPKILKGKTAYFASEAAAAPAFGTSEAAFAMEAAPAEASSPVYTLGSASPDAEEAEAAGSDIRPAQSYDEIYDAILSTMDRSAVPETVAEAETTDAADVPAGAEVPAPAPAADGVSWRTDAGVNGDYSRTNTQVAGVDEADIVKTDGKNIYYLTNGTLCIAEADGPATRLLSQTDCVSSLASDSWNYPIDIYLSGDRLVVLVSSNRMVWTNYGDSSSVLALIYDISDPVHPKQVAAPGQSGYYTDSRLIGNSLYLVTVYSVWNAPVASEPRSFVPYTVNGDAEQPVAAKNILIGKNQAGTTYTVVSAIDIAAPDKQPTSAAVLGGTGHIYMNERYLLLAGENYLYEQGDITVDEQGRHVCVRTSRTDTDLVLFAVGDGNIAVRGTATVPGYPIGQYAMDIYGDTVRIVTTVNTWEERIYTDGIDTYEYDDETYSRLTVLDGSLAELGCLSHIAEGEYVRSCRFAGDICHFVTFRQTDPLFSVDLSDPAAPKLLGALKITGFSEYLHPYTDGHLFGIGYEADETTGWTENVKLTMFDTSDNTDVKVLHTEQLTDADWSSIGSQPQAILVDASRALIAFPASGGYYIYTYTDTDGFLRLMKIDCGIDTWGGDMRGLFIGQYFYIVSADGIHVVDMASWAKVGFIPFPKG